MVHPRSSGCSVVSKTVLVAKNEVALWHGGRLIGRWWGIVTNNHGLRNPILEAEVLMTSQRLREGRPLLMPHDRASSSLHAVVESHQPPIQFARVVRGDHDQQMNLVGVRLEWRSPLLGYIGRLDVAYHLRAGCHPGLKRSCRIRRRQVHRQAKGFISKGGDHEGRPRCLQRLVALGPRTDLRKDPIEVRDLEGVGSLGCQPTDELFASRRRVHSDCHEFL